jgi:type I restriction enzyme, S subunit
VIEVSGGSPTQSTGRVVLLTSDLLQRFELPLICSNFCRLVRPRSTLSSRFLYHWLRWLYDKGELLQYENGTTGIKNLALTLFSKSHTLLVPPSDVLVHFDDAVAPILQLRQANGAQNETLAAIRDALLPKLLSGEVRVPEYSPHPLPPLPSQREGERLLGVRS